MVSLRQLCDALISKLIYRVLISFKINCIFFLLIKIIQLLTSHKKLPDENFKKNILMRLK